MQGPLIDVEPVELPGELPSAEELLDSIQAATARRPAAPIVLARTTTGDGALLPLASKPPSHVASLDGLRAVAVCLVLGVHAGMPGFKLGWLGVDIFFVLSGFLITTLLVKERDKTGTIQLVKFWARRALRLMPAYWLYIGVVTTMMLCGIGVLKSEGTWSPAWYIASLWGYFVNYVPQGGIWESAGIHFQSLSMALWSLSVEEQFYLIWPLTAFFLLRPAGAVLAGKLSAKSPSKPSGPEHQLIGSILLLLMAIAILCMHNFVPRLGTLPILPDSTVLLAVGCLVAASIPQPALAAWGFVIVIGAYRTFHVMDTGSLLHALSTRGIGIVMGCAVAMTLRRGVSARWKKILGAPLPRAGVIVLTLAIIGILSRAYNKDRVSEEWINIHVLPLLDLLFAAVIVMLWYGPTDLLARLLAWRPLAYLGKISYGIYLYHLAAQMLIWDVLLKGLDGWPSIPKFGLRVIAFYGLTIAIASVSYHFLERPFLRLKDRVR